MNANTILTDASSSRLNVQGPSGARPASRSATTTAGLLARRRILVVDDDPVVLKTTEIKLKEHGFAVSTAVDGPSAIHAARSERPDLILLDLNFPPDVSLTWDGFGIMNWLRRLDVTKSIPVIIVTGKHEKNLYQRAQAAGAAGLFNKPLNFEPLISLIELRLKAAATASPGPAMAVAKD